jgi:methionyl-tRNA formyltransferase
MEKSDIISHEAPGTVISDRKTLLVKTGNGVVSLLSIQPENKKVMMAKDFLNGQKLLTKGDVFNT